MTPRPVQQALDAQLDSLACNGKEARMLFNPSPEVDSHLEYIQSLTMPPETRRVLLGSARLIMVQNRRERDHSRVAAGALDKLAHRRLLPTVKQLATDLRPLLAEEDGTGYVRLVCRVRDLMRNPLVGAGVLRSEALAHELGRGPASRLVEVLDAIEQAA